MILTCLLPSFVFAEDAVSAIAGREANEIQVSPPDSNQKDESIPIEKIESSKDIPGRVLFLKLNHVDDAKTYEIQIRPQNRSWVDPYSVKTDREKLRLRVTPGKYEIRTRSIDARNRRGGWLAWRAFTVPFKQPTNVYPAENMVIAAKGSADEKLTFEWPEIKSARGYRFKLYDEKRKLLRHAITTRNWNIVPLTVKQNYFWSVTPLVSMNDVDRPEFEKLIAFELSEPDPELTPVGLTLTANPRAIKYQFELVKMLSEDESSEPTIYESFEAEFKARLAPGRYELRVRTVYDNNTTSAWGRPTAMSIPIPRPELIAPEHGAAIEPFDDQSNPIQLRWKKSKWASAYQVMIYNTDHQLIHQEIAKQPELTVRLPHRQSYTWSVKALLPGEISREPANEYQPRPSDRSFEIGQYIKLALGQSEEPSQLYAWSRFMFSNINYLAENYDNGNRLNQSLLASTGEIAAGYWHRKTSYGVLATGSLSGIDVAGTTSFYNQYSLLAGYRKSFEDQKRLRFWIGPSIKETPEVMISGFNNNIDIKTIGTLGPSALAAFFDSFNETSGYQIYVGAFYGMMGLSTPNGLDQKQFSSYFASIYGTYKWSKDVTSLLGYTFQRDEAGYKSADRSGNDNHVNYAGHYLSLSIIFGLQEAEK